MISAKYSLAKKFFPQLAVIQFQHFSSSSKSSDVYDVVVAGGGMVGAAMACSLGKSPYMDGKRILLLDAGTQKTTSILDNNPDIYSNRVCAISPGNVEFLNKLNIWDRIPRTAPVKKMQVWDACSDALLVFEQNNMADDLCFITENDMIVSSLMEQLTTNLKGKVEVLFNKKITECSVPRNYARDDMRSSIPLSSLVLDDNSCIKTKLLIGADGFNSMVSKSANITKIGWNYDQSAVVATLKLQDEAENIVAWQRFLPTGPIAILPLNKSTSSLVWSTSHKHASTLTQMNHEQFVNEINNAMWKEYEKSEITQIAKTFVENAINLISNGSIQDVMQFPPSIKAIEGPVQKFPLGLSHATEYVKPRLALIGDAIHRVHPLAGQGVNLGFRDVECLAKILDEAIYNGKDIGSLSSLLVYEKERKLENVKFLAMTDFLKNIYSTNNPSIATLRSMGMTAFNNLPQLQDIFMKEAIQ